MRQHKYEYDAFISHAVEDKIPIANELCARLERAGLRIWYSGKELGIGDSIEKTIASGLNRSRYGIVIFSPTYLSKNWTIREFYTLLAKEIEEEKVILPVLYNITLDELKNKDLVMADRFAVDADRGIDHVVDRLVAEIKRPVLPLKRKEAWFSKMWLVLVISLLANVALLLKDKTIIPSTDPRYASPAQHVGQIRQAGYPSTLLGEIQQLLAEANTCRHEHSYQPAAFEETDRDFRAADAGREGNFSLVPAANGQKVTMAIVFQIEDSPAAAPARETDEIFQTISLDDEERLITLRSVPEGRCVGAKECAGRAATY